MKALEEIEKNINYGVQQRIRFIDFLLFKYGYIKTMVVMDYFGVGHATVMRDIQLYRSFRPKNIIFNTTEKAYYRTLSFKPIWDR